METLEMAIGNPMVHWCNMDLQRCVVGYVILWGLEADFAEWPEKENVFFSTPADRIVTGGARDEAPAPAVKISADTALHEKKAAGSTLTPARLPRAKRLTTQENVFRIMCWRLPVGKDPQRGAGSPRNRDL